MGWQLEAFASVLLLLNVWLVARRSLWNYAFGILAVLVYAGIFFETRLYAVAGLQIVFLALNLYGLLNWRTELAHSGEVSVSHLSSRDWIVTIAGLIALTVGIGLMLSRTTDAAQPYLDSATTAISLAAQYWQARRKVDTWYLWLGVNAVSIALYTNQGLWLTALTYALLAAIAVHGLIMWRRAA